MKKKTVAGAAVGSLVLLVMIGSCGDVEDSATPAPTVTATVTATESAPQSPAPTMTATPTAKPKTSSPVATEAPVESRAISNKELCLTFVNDVVEVQSAGGSDTEVGLAVLTSAQKLDKLRVQDPLLRKYLHKAAQMDADNGVAPFLKRCQAMSASEGWASDLAIAASRYVS